MHIATAEEVESWTAREWPVQEELREWLGRPEHIELADQIALEVVDLAVLLHRDWKLQDRPDTQFVVQSFWRALYGLPLHQSLAVGDALRIVNVPWPALRFPG